MEYTKLGIRMTEEFFQEVQKTADDLMESKAGVGHLGLELMTGFDPDFYKQISQAAKNLGIPLWLFIQNSMIREMALHQVKRELDPDGEELLPHFMFTSKGFLTGKELFDHLVRYYRQELTK